MTNIEELMSISEAVEALGITRAAVYRAINRGEITAYRVGAHQLLLRSDVAKYQPIAYAGRPGRSPSGRPKKRKEGQTDGE